MQQAIFTADLRSLVLPAVPSCSALLGRHRPSSPLVASFGLDASLAPGLRRKRFLPDTSYKPSRSKRARLSASAICTKGSSLTVYRTEKKSCDQKRTISTSNPSITTPMTGAAGTEEDDHDDDTKLVEP
ncbi:hypothetical protein CGLO_10649 [Colletotrichum gloeosporioides Cg-14]|uniref:Uncharacterized protein n=1 Tax=Colletotrichum gloeosporioides (strain Cg-14) TaxID=1237896 RepID=T0LEJ9_COLGC|nr:hypothetical protein CGLO_10649 [Colletotrichum gloeosporioides Cg-14]